MKKKTPKKPTPKTPAPKIQTLEDIAVQLDNMTTPCGAEWHMKLVAASECYWSAEVRITPFPNANGCDRSLVSYITGGHDALDVAVLAAADAEVLLSTVIESVTDQPEANRKAR